MESPKNPPKSTETPAVAAFARRGRWLALTTAGALLLSACGGGDASEDASEESSPSTPEPTASVETPEESEVTEPGTELRFGQSATVDYKIRKQGTLLELTVNSARRGKLADFAGFNMSDPYQRNANYYYVRVKAQNVGESPLNNVEVPLWGISGDNTLLPPVRFTSSFKKCPTEPTPKKFRPDKTHQTCLVFLSPNKGTLEGVSYRPVQTFDPIEWRGQVKAPVTKAKAKKNRGGGGGGGGNN